MADDVSIKISIDATSVGPGVAEVRAQLLSIQTAVEGMQGSMTAMGSTMKSAFADLSSSAQNVGQSAKEGGDHAKGMLATIASGAGELAKFAGEAMKGGGEVIELGKKVYEFAKGMGEAGEKTEHTSKALGMTVADTQRLGSVFTQAGAGPDALSTAMTSLNQSASKAVSGNKDVADAFKKIGVDLSVARTPAEQMDATLRGLAELPGPERAAAATKIFGDKVETLGPIVGLTKEKLEEFNKQAESSGAVMPGAVAQAAALGEAMDASQNAMNGVSNVLADALAPSLTEIIKSMTSLITGFTNSYTSGGLVKQLMDAIGVTIHAVGVIFDALVDTIGVVWNALIGGAQGSHDAIDGVQGIVVVLGQVIVTLGWFIQVTASVIKGAVDGVIVVFQTLGTIIGDVLTLNWGKIQGDFQRGFGRLADIVKGSARDIAAETAKANAQVSAVGATPQRAAEPQNETKAVAATRDRKGVLAAKPTHAADQVVTERLQEGTTQAASQSPAAQAPDDLKATTADQIEAANKVLLAKKASIAEEIKATQDAVKAGEVSEAQGLATIKAKIEERKQAEIDAATAIRNARLKLDEAEIAAATKNADAHNKALDKKLADEKAYNDAVAKARADAAKALAEQEKATYEKTRAEAQKFYTQIGDFARTTTEGLIQGTTTWGQAFLKVGQMMLDKFLGWIEKMAVDWAAKETAKTAVTVAGVTERTAAEEAGQNKTLATSLVTTLKEINNSAVAAAAAAYKSLAGVPFIGPALGAAAAAVTYAAVLGFGAMASAEGGYDIPAGSNPLTQLHAQEMVLPASIATPLRASLASGAFAPAANQNAANDSGGDIHLHISAMDGASVHRALTSEHGQRALRAAFDKARAGGVVSRERWS